MDQFDFYYSEQHLCLLKNSSSYKRPTVTINGITHIFTEVIQHGKKSVMPFSDLIYIGTTTIDKIRLEEVTDNIKPSSEKVRTVMKNMEREVEKRKAI